MLSLESYADRVERTLIDMKIKSFPTFVILVLVLIFNTGDALKQKRHFFNFNKADNVMDVTDFSIYYDLNSNETIRKMMPRPWYIPGWRLRLPFRGGRCNCEGLQCTCCSGMRIPTVNFDKRTCAVLTFDPAESLLDLEVIMNNDSVFHRAYSAQNPPPFCVPIPVPYLPPNLVDMCIRLFDITVDLQKLHVCMDWDTRVDKAPVLILHFDCMDMGTGVSGGIGLSKPGSSNQQIGIESADTVPAQLDSDVYDPVTEDPSVITQSLYNNSIKYI